MGDRFLKQAAIWRKKIDPQFYAFNDMHAVMSFVGAGAESDALELIQSRERWLETLPPSSVSNARMTREIGLPVCKALLEFGRGNYTACVRWLYPIRQRLHEFGGSHAQRDVVLKTLLEAALRDGQYALARDLSAQRLDARPRSPYNWQKHAVALNGLGETARAAVIAHGAVKRREAGRALL